MTRIIAHRGAHGPGAPENTLAAFERAIELGADMVELDVRRDHSGALVVAHDIPAAADRPALLADALELCRGRIGVNAEIKEPGCLSETLALLDPAECLLTSFHEAVIREARALAPSLPTGLLLAAGSSPEAAAASCGASHLVLGRGLEPRPGCLMWTINDPAELERYLSDPAVAGVITDVPELALELRARLSPRTALAAPS